MPPPVDRSNLASPAAGSVPLRPLAEPRGAESGLPQPLTSLIGRDAEMAAVGERLRGDVRLMTLTGPGGVGKTRLALAIAEGLAPEFAHGAVYVPLASLGAPVFVAPAIAQRLGVAEERDRRLLDRIAARLGACELLLVLDNFEHILPAAPLVTELLAACPGVKVLVTSRAPLRVSGEHVFPTPPLALPDPACRPALDALAEHDAVRLFVERARAVKPTFGLTAENADAIVEICRRLDGLPLAVELAAARVSVLPPAALLARLARRLPVLTGGAQDLPDRQRTLRDAIAWSYDLLSPQERALFRRLAVFPGGCTLEAAEAVCVAPADAGLDVLEGLTRLVDHSLVAVRGPDEAPRFGMLETVREFGLERLEAAGETDATRDRQAAYHLDRWRLGFMTTGMAMAARPWLDGLEAEDDTLWSILSWSLERGELETGLRLAGEMLYYWYLRKRRVTEARAWLDRALERGRREGVSDPVLAEAMTCASGLAHLQGDTARAKALAEEAMAIFRRAGTPHNVAAAHYVLAIPVYMEGDCARAERLYREALDYFRAEGDRSWMAEVLLGLANVALERGEHDRAAAAYEESLQHARALGSRTFAARAQSGLGFVARARGDPASAYRRFAESLVVWAELGDATSTAVCLEAIADPVCALGGPPRAARLLGAAEALRERLSYPVPRGALATYRQTVEGIQRRLSMRQFAIHWTEGRALSPTEAVALACEALSDPGAGRAKAESLTEDARGGPSGTPRAGGATLHGLTLREMDVVRLVAHGHSNREIADALFISVPTVKRHLTNILGKLGLPSRSALNTYAHTHGLV